MSDEEKAEIKSISTFESTKKNSYNSHYVAISPDGTQIVTLDTKTNQIYLCKSDNLELSTVNYNNFKRYNVPVQSLAVSNEFTLANGNVDVLIAVSCFNYDDMNYSSSNELYPSFKKKEGSTWIISSARQSRISCSINNMNGIVKFLDSKKNDDSTKIVLINTDGITKFLIEHETIKDENDIIFWFNSFLPDKSIEKFYFPEKSYIPIQKSLIKDRFVVENYKNKVQTVKLYNLKTNLLENTFQKSEESAASVVGKGSSCFAISNNESLFAYCRGSNSITIYLMENGLEVTTKKFNGIMQCVRILFFDFVQDDSKLLIFIEEERYNEYYIEENIPTIVVWDLFSVSYSSDSIRKVKNPFSSLSITSQSLVNSSGNLITVTEEGTMFSILDQPEIINLLNPKNDKKRNVISLETPDFSSSTTSLPTTIDHYLIYDSYGKRLNFKNENSKGVIIVNNEPWVRSKRYKRILIYLDDDKSVQLIIGESTVQVWHERKSEDSPKKVLEYIWTNNYSTEKNRKMQIKSLEVCNKEFSLTLFIPSGISPSSKLGNEIKLEWPEKVNNLVDACQALEFLDSKKNEPSDPKKQHEFEDLVQQTEHIIKRYLIRSCGLWRMLDIRFNIMANLIRGNRVSIIRNILSFESSNNKNKYLHIPRCYSWDKQVKVTDLEIAIRCTKGGYRKDTIIVKYLLDYYSDNAIKSSNWMFTVTKAIPLLYEHQLEFYVKELFQKPCFGVSDVYLEQSNISKKDMKESNYKDIHALDVNLGLVKRKEYNFLQKLISHGKQSGKKTISNITNMEPTTPLLVSQVYVVPLPDFTVYPEKIDYKQEYWKIPFRILKVLIWPRGHVLKQEEKLSPFLRMVRNDDSAEIYDNPSIAAVIDLRWRAASRYFLRHAFMFLIFAILFAVINSVIKRDNHKISIQTYILHVLFYWLGVYLLNTEIIQLRYDGWKRYFSLYNFFDLFSVVLPLIVVTVQLYYTSTEKRATEEVAVKGVQTTITIFNSFTILVLWLELFLLLRYFERAGTYIYIFVNILKQIIPFLVFIIMVVCGFGHAMFILLSDTKRINVDPVGSSYSLNDITNGVQYKMNQDINVEDTSDNYFASIAKSVEAVFFWTSGRWDQLEQWNFWPVDVYSIIGSILLVTILQNMLIAIMTGAYDDAKVVGRHAVLKYRAELIADYETIKLPFGKKEDDSRYIYFFGKSDYIEEWLESSKKARDSYNNLLSEIDNDNSWYYDDDDDDIQSIINNNISNIYSTDSQDWFIDEDNEEDNDNDKRDDIKVLQNKIQSMEETIKDLISSLNKNKSQ